MVSDRMALQYKKKTQKKQNKQKNFLIKCFIEYRNHSKYEHKIG